MQEIKKEKKEINVVWEIELPEEVRLSYREWMENPFPIFIERVTKIKNGNIAVVGSSSENQTDNRIYIIFFPGNIQIPSIVEGTVMDVRDNKVVFIENDDETPF